LEPGSYCVQPPPLVMKTNTLAIGTMQIVEFVSDEILIRTPQDALDVMGNNPADGLIFYSHNFEGDFFDLSTQKLGEILQKFTNYRVRVAIIGDFDIYPSKVLKEFIQESNRFGDYLFVSSLDEVKNRWQE